MVMPELVRRSAEKIMTSYCSEHVSPGARDRLRLFYRIGEDQITLFAERSDTGGSGPWIAAPVARFRFSVELGQWTLHYRDRDRGWRFYLNAGPTLDLRKLLQHLDADPLHFFWE